MNDLLPDRASVSSRPGVVHSLANGRAVIAVASGGCSSCGQQRDCGIGKLAGDRKQTLIEVPADARLNTGDRVTLEVPADQLPAAAAIGYLLPAISLLVGALVGDSVGGSDSLAAFGGLTGLALGLWATRRVACRLPQPEVRLSLPGEPQS